MNITAMDLIDELRAYKRSHALATAIELGVLDALLEEKATIDKLCSTCGFKPEYGRLLLNVLRHFDLVKQCDGEYALTPAGRELARNSAFVTFAAYHMHVFEAWQALGTCCKGEANSGDFHRRRIADPSFSTAYLESMETIAQNHLPRLVQRCGPLLRGSVLDIGAGPSSLCRHLAGQGKCEVTAIDLPAMVRKAQELFSFPKSYKWIAQDFRCFRPSTRFDGVFCGHVLEYCSTDTLPQWLMKIRNCLRPGGYLVLVLFLRESVTLNVDLDLFELSTGLNGEYLGHVCTVEEMQTRLEESGAGDISIDPLTQEVTHPEYTVSCRWDT